MSVAFLLIVLFGLLLLGVPVAISLGVSAVLTMLLFSSYDVMAVPEIMLNGLKPALMAIPMFILAGSLMSKGSSANRIVEFAKSLVGHLPGGLPMSAILACIIFAAVSGSSPATVVAIGSVMFVALKEAGYPKSYSVGAITSAGSLGILIPPSVVMIVYGVTAEVSIEKLFVAGVVPGLLVGGMMMLYAYFGAKRLGFKATKPASLKTRWLKFKEAFWALLIVFVVIGGIYAGIFTATEAAGISAVYAFIVSLFVYKDIKFKDLYVVFLDAAITTAMIFFIIGFAVVFAHFLTGERIPHAIAEYLVNMQMSWWMFLIFVNIALFIMGQFMEPSSVVMIMTPLLLPIALKLGIDPIHFGIVMIVNMELGMLTPPVGLNLFVASSLTGLSLKDITLSIIPWLCVLLIGLGLITYIPEISLWLPSLLG
ncbi:TRAP transporter large permease [Helicobacter turcicus]|uniref:TRAP transporter large permease subunit n=1 Tax=Helicobacter turcicus TaxID=2867412 RepID=A0ABS7JPN5_9HELI|nr:TRAP transporter large permease subunit [Helicobacter turcicus]MBX7491379.1 TRAP transporter large permease subunit [Helicobacter turcicus]MBX7546246.1 TRAP transporter large permease subunit [Helicobacter turcicus]